MSGTGEMFSFEELMAGLACEPIEDRIVVECCIERPGLEWEYLIHVQTTTHITVAQLLDHARRVLAGDEETVPAQWIHAPLAQAQLCGKGGETQDLNRETPLWKLMDSMADKNDPLFKFTLSPHFHKQFVFRTCLDKELPVGARIFNHSENFDCSEKREEAIGNISTVTWLGSGTKSGKRQTSTCARRRRKPLDRFERTRERQTNESRGI